MKHIYYVPLESVKSRYTDQLCNSWMPSAFHEVMGWFDIPKDQFITVRPDIEVEDDITTGQVLDAQSRCRYAMAQCAMLCDFIAQGKLVDGDLIYLQDFWTPGIESVLYCLHQHGITARIYAMMHAQTFDEHDFTYKMKEWMRPMECGLLSYMALNGGGVFVASSCHKGHIETRVTAETEIPPIHVVSLPYDPMNQYMLQNYGDIPLQERIVYSSRLDEEKRPEMMLEFAGSFLKSNPQWTFVITSSKKRATEDHELLIKIGELKQKYHERFLLMEGLNKVEYYEELAKAKYLLNTSLQDYVSWTLLEGLSFGCLPIFPNYRSFPEILPEKYLYNSGQGASYAAEDRFAALQKEDRVECLQDLRRLLHLSNVGRHMVAFLAINGGAGEFNLWKDRDNFAVKAIERFLRNVD